MHGALHKQKRFFCMNYETFDFPIKIGTQGQIGHRTLSAQFGDGYEQVAPAGIHNQHQSWPIEVICAGEQASALAAFLNRHGEHRPFYWRAPLDNQKRLWRVKDGTQITAHGADIYTFGLTLCTFGGG